MEAGARVVCQLLRIERVQLPLEPVRQPPLPRKVLRPLHVLRESGALGEAAADDGGEHGGDRCGGVGVDGVLDGVGAGGAGGAGGSLPATAVGATGGSSFELDF